VSNALRSRQVVPIVLTCARSLEYVRAFTRSWRDLESQDALPIRSPIVVVDLTASPVLPGEYVDEIASLDPRVVVVHARLPNLSEGDSVQDAAFFALEQGVRHRRDEETHLLFLEDDVVLSSRFQDGLYSCDPSPDLGYTTLYQPWDGYGAAGPVSSETVRGGHFYGTQCLLMPFDSAGLLLEHRASIERDYPPGYDLRWSRFLVDRGRSIHTTEKSYVQHVGVVSRLGCMSHRSNVFVE